MTNITAEHRAAFEALTSGRFDNFALFSCFIGGEPAAAIVALTPGMVLTDHDGRPCETLPPGHSP